MLATGRGALTSASENEGRGGDCHDKAICVHGLKTGDGAVAPLEFGSLLILAYTDYLVVKVTKYIPLHIFFVTATEKQKV